jgi:hypothetical protein
LACVEPAYWATKIPANIPVGIANRPPRAQTINVPTMEFDIPPPISPTGWGRWVKKSTFRELIP